MLPNCGQVRSLFISLEEGWLTKEERLKLGTAALQERINKDGSTKAEFDKQMREWNKQITEMETLGKARDQDRINI
jgi:hypothetical protein